MSFRWLGFWFLKELFCKAEGCGGSTLLQKISSIYISQHMSTLPFFLKPPPPKWPTVSVEFSFSTGFLDVFVNCHVHPCRRSFIRFKTLPSIPLTDPWDWHISLLIYHKNRLNLAKIMSRQITIVHEPGFFWKSEVVWRRSHNLTVDYMYLDLPVEGCQMVVLQGVHSTCFLGFCWHPDWKVLEGK